MTTPIKVEQVDVDAAKAVHDRMAHLVAMQGKIAGATVTAVPFPDGADEYWLVQAFAQARIAAEAKTREEDARIADEHADQCDDTTLGRRRNETAHDIAAAIRSGMETDNGR